MGAHKLKLRCLERILCSQVIMEKLIIFTKIAIRFDKKITLLDTSCRIREQNYLY